MCLREPKLSWVAQIANVALGSKVDHLNSSTCCTILFRLVGSGYEEKDAFR